MKKVILLTIVCFATIAAVAQGKADIEVSYNASLPNFRTGEVDRFNQFLLIANSIDSKFYSPMTEYIDSLESTPEGKAKYKEMTRSAFAAGKMDKMPRRDGRYYVIKSSRDNTVTTYDVNGLDKYVTDEPMPEWNWQISDSVKNLLGYECQMAVTQFHGREWTVWFATEIPVMNGPWKLGGLPGLILEASDQSGLYTFAATGIQPSSKDIIPVYSSDSYDNIDRKELLKAKRKMIDNPVSQMNAQLSGLGISIQANANTINHKSREEVDFIETDY